jgi:hypothetical protein
MFIVTTAAPLLTQPVISVTNVTTVSAQINLITAATGAASLTYFLTVTANPVAPLPASIIYFVDAFPYTVSALVPGTPYAFTLQATETATNIYRSAPSISQQIATGSGSVAITTASPLPGAIVGKAYGSVVAASGGTSPYTWSITAATPDTGSWLAINASTGVLTGIPGTAETESVTVKVTDALSQTVSKTFSLNVASSGGVPLLSYLQSLAGPGKVLTGQIAEVFQGLNADPYGNQLIGGGFVPTYTVSGSPASPANITGIAAGVSSIPAMMGIFIFCTNANTTAAQNLALINGCIARGIIPFVTFSPPNPLGYQYYPGSSSGYRNPFPGMTLPGNAAYNTLFHGSQALDGGQSYYGGYDQMISVLSQVTGPFILSPYREFNGNWEWFGIGTGPDVNQAQTMLQQLHAYAAPQLPNAIWCYGVNSGNGNYGGMSGGSPVAPYPGGWQLCAFDYYGNNPVGDIAAGGVYTALAALNLPIFHSEAGEGGVASYGRNTLDNSVFNNAAYRAAFPKVCGVMISFQSWALSYQNGANTFLNEAWSVNLSQLPVLT